jgi:hypothetical protein
MMTIGLTKAHLMVSTHQGAHPVVRRDRRSSADCRSVHPHGYEVHQQRLAPGRRQGHDRLDPYSSVAQHLVEAQCRKSGPDGAGYRDCDICVCTAHLSLATIQGLKKGTQFAMTISWRHYALSDLFVQKCFHCCNGYRCRKAKVSTEIHRTLCALCGKDSARLFRMGADNRSEVARVARFPAGLPEPKERLARPTT